MKKIAAPLCAALVAFAFVMLGTVSIAAEPDWTFPAIQGFGKVVALPNASVQPSKEADYKALFNVAGPADADKVNPNLDKVARAVNIFASAGIPLSHLHFIAVLHGPSTAAALDNAHYREKFGVDNPNIKLIDALEIAGVKVIVCGQALAHNKFPHEWVNPKVEITLSAISDIIILEQQGYVLVPL
jgi:intracellular sulfur oxidation DsrE/DsrF family protein